MKKFGVVALAAFAAVLVVMGFTSSAQAYPDVQITLTANKQVVSGGDSFTATASASVGCAWSLDWNGDVRTGTGQFSTTFTAPTVTKITKISLHGLCTYGDSARASAAPTTWQRQLTVTVLPSASAAAAAPTQNNNGSADLPNTGGPNRVFLLSGLVLLLAGATAVTVARRRAEAELPARTA